jgi:hypothetical protein
MGDQGGTDEREMLDERMDGGTRCYSGEESGDRVGVVVVVVVVR